MIAEPPKILVAGIGNIFHGDDAFGVELAQRLLQRPQRDGVRVVDFGIRSYDLTYALLDGADATILLDATARGGAPGTLYTIEIDPGSRGQQGPLEGHGMNPMRVLEMVATMGGVARNIFLVGCEPLTLGSEEEGMLGLSPVVADAVERAVPVVEALVARLLNESKSAEEVFEWSTQK